MATSMETPDWECSVDQPKKSVFRKSNPFRVLSIPLSRFSKSSSKASPLGAGSKEGSPRGSNVNLAASAQAFDKETEAPINDSAQAPGEVTEKRKPTIFGRDRTRFLLICALIIILIALIIGLAVGLTKKSSSKPKNLPLPSNKETFTGDLTYYSPGPGYGACGFENTSEDSICAVSHIIWDAVSTSSNPNNNPLCGKKIRITRYDATRGGNSSVDVEVVDRCVGCKASDLDLSLKMFTSLADESLGRVVGSWAWLN